MSHDHDHAVKEPIGWMDKPDFVKRLFLFFYVLCGLLIVAELVLGTETAHPHPMEERVRFFLYPLYGFASFWFLVLIAKPMRKLLIRSEDYYDAE
ncbi:MAG: hypothetical protein O2958_13505 [Gemmatimonadetes bacterium]|nr:hypothetical protein [Gemmatimonadota bacterium]MDA1103241.1 hypothetical protein [Gemmatimonadota bacterium]